MPEYKLGFKQLAEELGYSTVGEPEMDETAVPVANGRHLTVQLTENGVMVYTEGGVPKFLPAKKG